MRRTGTASFLAIALSASIVAMAPQPAAAAAAYILIPSGTGQGGCPGGYVCLWEGAFFTGRGVGFFNSAGYYGDLSSTYSWINNYSESAFNNGNTSDIRFGRFSNLRGGTFVLCMKDAIAVFPHARDEGESTSTDDDDTRPGFRWTNQISSHEFFHSNWC